MRKTFSRLGLVLEICVVFGLYIEVGSLVFFFRFVLFKVGFGFL